MACLWLLFFSFCRLIWQIFWWFLPTRSNNNYQATPIHHLRALPSIYLVLSCVQLTMWFIKIHTKWRFHDCQDLLQWFLIHVAATGMLTFRKPPNIAVQIYTMIIVIEQKDTFLRKFGRSLWSIYCDPWNFLFSFFKSKSSFSSDDVEAMIKHEEKLVACMANKDSKGDKPRYEANWDSDQHPIVLDTAASRTMTPLFSDLIDPVPYNTSVSGIGTGKITHRGRIRWDAIDEDGQVQTLEDAEAYYSPDTPY